MPAPLHPSLYEINTRVWLNELSARLGRRVTLDQVPDETLDQLATFGFDWVWLLGVWQTGPLSRQVSRTDADCLRAYRVLLPDFTEADICGSPFAVAGYTVHSDFGGDQALARLRERLDRRGIRLLLDFVPNHTALDNPWVQTHPEYFIHGTDDLLRAQPHNYIRMATSWGPRVLAHGRDPYFPGWTDTLQLNYCHAGLRAARTAELGQVADRCDGVRCDMAMLLLPDVIRKTWGDLARPADGSAPVDALFWPDAIASVRARRPEFVFMAEVYWDLEWALQQQGFDYTYDKRLYDRLHQQDAGPVRGHLHADADFQRKSVRFLENHDEPRAAAEFPPDVHRAAAVVTFFAPGLRFFHDGQLEGRRVRTSVHLGRRVPEPVDLPVRAFYLRLLECLKRPEVRGGRWQLLDCTEAWPGNQTWDRYLAFWWEDAAGRLLAVVNFSPTRGQCHTRLPEAGLRAKRFVLKDLLGDAVYPRDGDDLAARGLYLDLPAWGYNAFALEEQSG